MRSTAVPLNDLLQNLEKEDYDKAVSYIEFLVSSRKNKRIRTEKTTASKAEVKEIVASLIGAIPDTGKTPEEYRNERLRKYELSD